MGFSGFERKGCVGEIGGASGGDGSTIRGTDRHDRRRVIVGDGWGITTQEVRCAAGVYDTFIAGVVN